MPIHPPFHDVQVILLEVEFQHLERSIRAEMPGYIAANTSSLWQSSEGEVSPNPARIDDISEGKKEKSKKEEEEEEEGKRDPPKESIYVYFSLRLMIYLLYVDYLHRSVCLADQDSVASGR
ncbi:hypothetical protein TWF506_011403 [Arthrobotrys conoides]|uniref:Uncharacterized protein n=1 Tax=Arthrobotrys conoides TaxID=74498 RepID=A0AAN8NB45_9PEZI